MMIGDAMTQFDPTGGPIWPRFTVDVFVFEVKFDVTAFDVNIFVVYVPVFDISYFPLLNWEGNEQKYVISRGLKCGLTIMTIHNKLQSALDSKNVEKISIYSQKA